MNYGSLFDESSMPMGISLLEYTRRVGNVIRQSTLSQPTWVKAELTDVRMSKGHCYMELIEKDGSGKTVAKLKGVIWASRVQYVSAKFSRATNALLRSGLKVMVCGTSSFHEQYGFSFSITDIDPSYTLGDMERIRREILLALQKEGILEANKQIPFPIAPQKIAIISSESAAGYGDFMRQLHDNAPGFKFYTKLFPAMMQGAQTSASVRQALQQIEMTIDLWDCIVIVRGGGATTDLNDFDDYELARAVATYQLPIIVGIGHERDRTVLDEIACVRVKTPTAVAEYLVSALQNAFDLATGMATQIRNLVTERLRAEERRLNSIAAGVPALCHRPLSQANAYMAKLQAEIPGIVNTLLSREQQRLAGVSGILKALSSRNTTEMLRRLEQTRLLLNQAALLATSRQQERLESLEALMKAYSPEHTLRRGYSITRVNGHSVTDAGTLVAGTLLETILAHGTIHSIVKKEG